jgi:hypothetical protein
MTLRARSCPTCHSIGEPRAWGAVGGLARWIDLPAAAETNLGRCTDPWHEPERVGRFEELLAGEHEQFDRRGELLRSIVEYRDASSGTASATVTEPNEPQHRATWARLAADAGRLTAWLHAHNLTTSAGPGAVLKTIAADLDRVTRERDAFARYTAEAEAERDEWKHRATELQPIAIHERESLRSENTMLRDLIRRFESPDDDSKLTYAELQSERDRLAVDLYRAQSRCHDCDEIRAERVKYGREVNRLADTVRRYQPVIDAARVLAAVAKQSTAPRTLMFQTLLDSIAALDASPGDAETGQRDDDLAEIDTTEEEIDRQFAEGEPVEVAGPQTFATSQPISRTWPAGCETGDGDE